MRSINACFKRIFDVTFAAIGVIVLSPLFVLATIAVKRSSPGPVIFSQTRIGRFERPFQIFKFRTMTVAPAASGAQITAAGDARITPIGHSLRRFKIDELPQLINVLKGDMSFVGPRPEVPAYVALYPQDQRAVIFSVRPGITDEASIEFRYESELLATAADPEAYYRQVILPRKCALYEKYAMNNNVLEDIMILARTVLAVFR